MNVYVATRGNMVGLVLTGIHNKIYQYKAFRTETTDPQAQITLATQRAVAFARANEVKYAGYSINLYSDYSADINKLINNEYLNRFNYQIRQKAPQTEEEKQRMLLAQTTIEMENRRWQAKKLSTTR